MKILYVILAFLSIFGIGMYINQMLVIAMRLHFYKSEGFEPKSGILALVSLLIASISISILFTLLIF